MSTIDNLKEAFAGESQANRKYSAFSRKAAREKFPQVAKLFRAAAAAEAVHAEAHLRALGDIKSTAEHLKTAIEGEGFEFQETYPKFLEEAEAEGNQAAIRSFRNALAVEKIHHELYSEALKDVEAGKGLAESKIFVCGVCGNTVLHGAPETCPICGAPRQKFFEVI